MVEVRDVAPGLWLWRQPHPAWREGLDWEQDVSSFVAESRGETILLDPLAPHPRERAVWDRLDASPPTVVVVMKPDHVRDVDLFVRWYGAQAYGPDLYFAGDGPKTSFARFCRATRCRAACVPSTTGAAEPRRRCISRSRGRLSLPTR